MTDPQYSALMVEVVQIRETLQAILALRNSARPTGQAQRAAPSDPGFKCPVCASPMKAKFARASGKLFYGCTKYPNCNGIRWEDGNVPKPRAQQVPRGEEPQNHPAY